MVVSAVMNDFIAMFSDPNALTGRTQIWLPLFKYAQEHWLLGAGYGSFWLIGPTSPIYYYTQNWVAGLGHGHNGYLDLLVQIGLPGLLLAIFALILSPLFKVFSSQTLAPGRAGLIVATIFFVVCHNMTESSLLDRDRIPQVFLMIAIALTEVAARGSAAPVWSRRPRHPRDRPSDLSSNG